ncbi:MAG: acyl-CoA dehydrogenase family protein [Deltaproteobacteria bacterium]|nr:acyl-CoA dehydrogenase family protein [Deltaproteobacteria bacterium]
MDFRDSPEERDFRSQFRGWLTEHAPGEPIPVEPEARAAFLLAWHRRLYAAGYVGLSFPVESGGRGLPPTYEAIFNDELGAAGAPPGPAFGHIANAIRLHGSEEQRRRHLPGLLSSQVRWCQGFSEPGAGSDLANLSTRAQAVEMNGAVTGYRITGQKIWTSEAVGADWCLLLARSEPGSCRHHGISVLLVPMRTPGIDCRAIVTASGTREFAEVFFDGAEVDAANLLGRPGQGWAIAMSLLGYERGPADIGWVSRFARTLRLLEDQARAGSLRTEPALRAALAKAYVDLRALQVQVQRTLSSRMDGSTPGPEGSIDKLLMTRTDQSLHRAMMDLRGAEPLLEDGLDLDLYFWSRAQSIFGGTSQIQRDIVAQRVLKLPRAGK